MRSLAAGCILALLAASAAEARKPVCTVRLHVEANANDTEVFSSSAASPRTGKKVVIEKIARISENDVAGFAVYPAPDGSYGVLFQLDDHGKLVLDTLSIDRRGRFAYVLVNGHGVAELQIDKRVTDGVIYVESGITPQDVALMRKSWPLLSPRRTKR
ncbi:MAG: hypothetical protein M3Y80_03785 [Verrucomicrobiota bacterium]|nr:hypothetical protein [Verrucomicrobiota bacterium]